MLKQQLLHPDILRTLGSAGHGSRVLIADGSEPDIFAEFRQYLLNLELQLLDRFAFYDAAKTSDTALVSPTAEQRIYANLLLTIGVVSPLSGGA